jgi:DNA-binding CsgD family transcriptional regulator
MNYDLLTGFFHAHLHKCFADISPADPQVVLLEDEMAKHGQFIIMGDLIQFNALYASKGYFDFFGDVNVSDYPLAVYQNGHPNIKERYNAIRGKFFSLGQDLYDGPNDKWFISTNLTIKNVHDIYVDLLFQCYLVHSQIPYRSVFVLMVHTDLSNIPKSSRGFHFYSAPDDSCFRFPDAKLLETGNIFTDREFEVIHCIAKGLDSEQIAEKLFISKLTVNTHRRNILKKTGNRNTQELVIYLQQKGMI